MSRRMAYGIDVEAYVTCGAWVLFGTVLINFAHSLHCGASAANQQSIPAANQQTVTPETPLWFLLQTSTTGRSLHVNNACSKSSYSREWLY